MTKWKGPTEPAAIPKSIRLRERARSLKAQAEGLLKKADALLDEAKRLEASPPHQHIRSQPSSRED